MITLPFTFENFGYESVSGNVRNQFDVAGGWFPVIDYYTPNVAEDGKQTSSVIDDWLQPVKPPASGYTPPRDFGPYQTNAPNVFAIPLTEKMSTKRGDIRVKPITYAPQSEIFVEPVVDTYTIPYSGLENTVVTNPTTLSLENAQFGNNALEANQQDMVTQLSGHDQMLSYLMNNSPSYQSSANYQQQTVDDSEQLSTSTTANECWIPSPVKGCLIRKDVRNETVIFLVGIVVLAIGVFALTR